MAQSGRQGPNNSRSSIADTRESLKRLDRQDWTRWISVIAATLLLTAGVFFLSLPALRRNLEEQRSLDVSVSSLFAIVLLFDLFAVHQQVIITRLRREMTKQVAMAATLEMLRPPDPETEEGRGRRRRFPRFHFDQRISVQYVEGGKQKRVYGRSSDLSEGGLGAVIPESLEPGTPVEVEVGLGTPDGKLVAPAVIRYRRGFHHCLEFVELTPEQAQQVRVACADATPAMDFHQDAAVTAEK